MLRLPANASDKTRPLFTPLASKNVPWPERESATQFAVCQCMCAPAKTDAYPPKWLSSDHRKASSQEAVNMWQETAVASDGIVSTP